MLDLRNASVDPPVFHTVAVPKNGGGPSFSQVDAIRRVVAHVALWEGLENNDPCSC